MEISTKWLEVFERISHLKEEASARKVGRKRKRKRRRGFVLAEDETDGGSCADSGMKKKG